MTEKKILKNEDFRRIAKEVCEEGKSVEEIDIFQDMDDKIDDAIDIESILQSTPKIMPDGRPVIDIAKINSTTRTGFKKVEIPLRILHSSEYKHFIKNRKTGNPYSNKSNLYHFYDILEKAQPKDDGWVDIAAYIFILTQVGLGLKYSSLTAFLSRLSEFIDLLSNKFIGVIEIDGYRIRIKPLGTVA